MVGQTSRLIPFISTGVFLSDTDERPVLMIIYCMASTILVVVVEGGGGIGFGLAKPTILHLSIVCRLALIHHLHSRPSVACTLCCDILFKCCVKKGAQRMGVGGEKEDVKGGTRAAAAAEPESDTE